MTLSPSAQVENNAVPLVTLPDDKNDLNSTSKYENTTYHSLRGLDSSVTSNYGQSPVVSQSEVAALPSSDETNAGALQVYKQHIEEQCKKFSTSCQQDSDGLDGAEFVFYNYARALSI